MAQTMADAEDTKILIGGETESPGALQTPESRFRRVMRGTGWLIAGFFLLLIFTIFKLPEARIKSFIQGNIAAALSERGIGLTAAETDLSMFFGVKYTMKDVTLSFPPPASPVKIEKISFSPTLLSLIFGRIGGKLGIFNGDGRLTASFSMKDTKLSLKTDIKSFDIKKLGLLPAVAAGATGSGILNGTGSLSGDLTSPTTLTGYLQLDVTKFVFDQQTVMGFSIPRINVSESKLDISVDKGKATIKTLRIGKPGSADEDIRATVTGDVTLGRQLEASTLNLKANFSLSQTILKSFVLLDAILGVGKRPDGSYAFSISGPAYNPTPMPLGAGQ